MAGILPLVASWVAGGLLGVAFFGGLWLTVNRLPGLRRPGLTMVASLVARFALVLGGFFLVVRYAGWPHLLAAAAGFLLCRLILVRRLGPAGAQVQGEA